MLAALGLFGGVMLHPASSALRAVMDQLFFGERPDPLDAAARVVGRIGEDPEEALRSLREDLAVPYVALWRGTRLVAQSGEPVHHVRRIVTHSGEAEEATLVVGMRAGDLRLSSGDAHVLKLVTPLLVQLVRTTELSAAVQDSRAQALTAIAFTTDAARNLLPDDPRPRTCSAPCAATPPTPSTRSGRSSTACGHRHSTNSGW